jgi:hypothetical protein
MNKPVLGLILGGVLGILDGLTALLSAPEVAPQIGLIVVGSMGKGLIAGVIIGAIARKLRNLPAGILVGLVISGLVTYPIAIGEDPNTKQVYFWEIMIPGMIVGMIVGFATQKYGKAPVAKAG